MKKKKRGKTLVFVISIFLAAIYLGIGNQMELRASDDFVDIEQEGVIEGIEEEPGEVNEYSIEDIVENDVVNPIETVEELQNTISFAEDNSILVAFKMTNNKVSDDPYDGRYYYNGTKIKPEIEGVYLLEKITSEEAERLEKDINTREQIFRTINKNEEECVFQKTDKLTINKDYTVTYLSTGKALGMYKIKISAKDTSKYTGEKIVSYEIIEKEHQWGEWKTDRAATVIKKGIKKRSCAICNKKETASIDKLKPTIKLNMKTIRLKRKQTTTKFKVSGLAKGDYVKSYKSSNKKIFTINKKGKITAKKKTGTAKLTVTLASGKKAIAIVKVQKGTVKTTKIRVNTNQLVLLKGGKYTLKTKLEPLTTQQKVKYSSSNKKIAVVSSKGVIIAKKKGTVKITVKSGSKKKTVKVIVQKPSSAMKNNNAFLQSCKKIADIIMKDGDWVYYSGPASGSNIKDSFAEARGVSPRQTNCANYVNFCMQDIGTLEPGMSFYSNSKGKIVYRGSAVQKAETKKMIEKNYNIINIGGKVAVKAGLQIGDICLYKGHTNVYAGLNDQGVPMWYDAGRNSTSDGKQQSGYFTNMYRASYYNKLPIYLVLRLKK